MPIRSALVAAALSVPLASCHLPPEGDYQTRGPPCGLGEFLLAEI